MRNWLLPEYIEDILPGEARRIEILRRKLLDLFDRHGYELVIPPLLEYMESLLTGTGHDMDIKTFKVVDQLSGRLMGIRADITPQVARIDAHLLNRAGITRLCYAGSVVHTLPSGLMQTREPLQIGAEVYGHAGIESDLEVQQLMVESLRASGLGRIHVDVGHFGVFRSLMRGSTLSPALEADLFQALQAKDVPSLRELTASLDKAVRDSLALLPDLYGDAAVLDEAAKALPDTPDVARALAELRTINTCMAGEVDEMTFDLADLRGYHYYNGVVFAAYSHGFANAVALGGRYDEIGKAFGRARPATGFSMDLRQLAAVPAQLPAVQGILAPHDSDPALRARIAELRARGERVIVDLPGHAEQQGELGCDRRLVRRDGKWEVVPF